MESASRIRAFFKSPRQFTHVRRLLLRCKFKTEDISESEIKRAGIDTLPVVPIVFALDNYGPVAAEYPVPFENGAKGFSITVRCMNEQFAMLATSLLLGAGGDGITAELLTNA